MHGQRDDDESGASTVVVVVEAACVAPMSALARASGAAVEPGWSVPSAPWDLRSHRLVRCGTVDFGVYESTLDLAVRGVSLLVGIPGESAPLDHEFLDALRRAARIEDWRTEPVATLDTSQVELLCALADGRTVTDAAAHAHMSRRTAHRQLARASEQLGTDTVAAATALVAGAMRTFRT